MIGDVVYGASVSQGRTAPYFSNNVYTNFTSELSWSFGLSVTASILCIISAILVGFAKKRRGR